MDRPSNHCDLSIACFCISILVGVNAFANNHLAYNHLAYNHLAYNDLKAIDMVDNNVGWAVGENSVILHTADGGKSWRRKFRNISHQDTTLFDVGFFTPKKGVAVGGRGLILRTTNGGKTWQRVTRLVSEERLAAQHELKKFKKQKQHFNSLVVKRCGGEGDPPNRAHSIVRFWKKYSQSENTVNSTDDGLLVYSREECVAALEWYLNKKIAGLEAIIRSAPKFSPPHWIGNYRFSKIHIVNKEVALLWYGTGFLKTSDGGATWRNVVASKFKGGQAIFFLTENKGWMVGHFGRVWRTNDGGDSWDQVGFPSKWNLSAVFVQRRCVDWRGQRSVVAQR